MTNTQNTKQSADFQAAGEQYTMLAGADLKIRSTTYTVETQVYKDDNYKPVTYLTGPRGASYFLRAYTNQAGLFQVISWTTGMPLRILGNPVEVIQLGNILEVVK
jgi:hypothetical protein